MPSTPKSPKVLELSSCFPPSRGGVENFVHRLTADLAKRSHQITVVTSSRGRSPGHYRERVGNVTVIRYAEKYHVFEAPIIPKIALAALTMDYDVLHVNGMNPGLTDLAVFFAKLRRKPVVVTYHNDAETHIWGLLGRLATVGYAVVARFALRFANVVVCTTLSYASTSRVVKYSKDRLKIIPLGVDTGVYGRSDLNGPSADSKRLLFVGQLKQYKGLHVLLESISTLIKQGYNVTLDVVGTGPESGRLKRRVDELALGTHVSFKGNVDEASLASLYANCKAFVLPSLNRREAFGLVLLEALAAGKPIIASDVPGVNEVVTRAGGFLARPNDPVSLASTIRRALDSVDGAGKYQEAARGMSWDAAALSYDTLFRSLAPAA